MPVRRKNYQLQSGQIFEPRRVQKWLQRLGQAAHFSAESTPEKTGALNNLSRRKLEKSNTLDSAMSLAGPARRKLLTLLARRVLALSLIDYDPLATYPLSFFEIKPDSGIEWNVAICGEVEAEIQALPASDLTGWALAGLQLWEGMGERSVRKRTGSFYTSPSLATYITARILSGVAPSNSNLFRIVDPACGGGVFLLAALEWLAANCPSENPALLIAGQLYGLDLNPEAADLTRLSLLRRATELNGGPLPSALLYQLAFQIRPGNALIGSSKFQVHLQGHPTGRSSKFKVPEVGLEIQNSKLKTQNSKLNYLAWVAEREGVRAELGRELMALPIFNNGVEDGRQLAALGPFDWAGEWPEVFAVGGFDAVLGNPPYVGFNDYSGVEKAYFAAAFPQIYNLKNDLLYYFIVRGLEILRPGGWLGYVTSRFWKEAAFAASLRRWLANETRLQAVEDFGAAQHFKQAMIDTCLLFIEKNPPEPAHTFEFKFDGRREQVAQAELDPSGKGLTWAWLRRQPTEELLTTKINEQSCTLGEIAWCSTGVQTGRDAVFFVDAASAAQLEPDLVRPAIKSADIKPGQLTRRDLYLIYLPPDFDPARYPQFLAYLEPHRAKLLQRLRYDKLFPYYELQWPRRAALFEAPRKLVTPYKAPRNSFALDCDQLYFSTDVISVVFKKADGQLEQFAVNFLNSRLATFQFRAYSKPVGGGQYDYYANPVKRLAFPLCALETESPAQLLIEQLSLPNLSQSEIDELVYELYGLNEAEKELINARGL